MSCCTRSAERWADSVATASIRPRLANAGNRSLIDGFSSETIAPGKGQCIVLWVLEVLGNRR